MASKISLKIHPQDMGGVVALCDSDLLGKKFSTGELVLDLKMYRRFYEGELVGDEAVVAALEGGPNVNAVGEKSVELACNALGLPKSSAKKIGGVPHLQIYRV